MGQRRHSWPYASPSHPSAGTGPVQTAAAMTKAPPPETQGYYAKDCAEPVGQPSPPRHLLPKDLPGAIARLDDGEIDVLLAAVIEEAKRRDRLPSGLMPKPREEQISSPHDPSQSNAARRAATPPASGLPQDDVSFFDAGSDECRSCRVQGWRQTIPDCAAVRSFAVRCRRKTHSAARNQTLRCDG